MYVKGAYGQLRIITENNFAGEQEIFQKNLFIMGSIMMTETSWKTKYCDENIVCEFCEEMIPITEAVEIM